MARTKRRYCLLNALYLICRIAYPIQMAQTRRGLMLAALLILGWQSSQTVLAAVANPGFSENDFFRVEWDYDLANGVGQIRFRANSEGMTVFFTDYWGLGPGLEHNWSTIWIDVLEFRTYGVSFDSVTAGNPGLFQNPTLINSPGDPLIYQYREGGSPFLSSSAVASLFSFGGASEAVIDVTFSTENIALIESSLGYGGKLDADFWLSGFGLSRAC